MGTSDTRRIPWRRVLGRRWLRHGGVAVLIALVAVLTITSPAEAARPRLLVDQTTGLDATQPVVVAISGIGLANGHPVEVRQCAGLRCRLVLATAADSVGQFVANITVSYQFVDSTGNLSTCASVPMIFECSISLSYLGSGEIDTVAISFDAVYQPVFSFSNTLNLSATSETDVTVTGAGVLANTPVHVELCQIEVGTADDCDHLETETGNSAGNFAKTVKLDYGSPNCDVTAVKTCTLRVFHGSPSGGVQYNTFTVAAQPVSFAGHFTVPATTAYTSSSAGSPAGLTFAGLGHPTGESYTGYQCVSYFGQDHCQLKGTATVAAGGSFSIVAPMLYTLDDGTLCHTDAPSVVCRAELRYSSGPNSGQVHSTYPIVLASPMSGSQAPIAKVLMITVANGSADIDPPNVVADASASHDGDGSPISTYTFNWGDGTVTGPQTLPVAEHTFVDKSQRSVTVVATDSVGHQSAGVTSAVPNVGIVESIGPLQGDGSRYVTLSITVLNQAVAQARYIRIIWSDGSVYMIDTSHPPWVPGEAFVGHTYALMPSEVSFAIMVEVESSVTGLVSTTRVTLGVDVVTGLESGINFAQSSAVDAAGASFTDSATGFVYSMTATPAYIEVSGSADGVFTGAADVTRVCMAETWTASTAGSSPASAPAANWVNLDTTQFKSMSSSLSPVVVGTGVVQTQLAETCTSGRSISVKAGGATNALRVTANTGQNPGTTMRCLSHWQRFRAYNGTTLVRELEARRSYCPS